MALIRLSPMKMSAARPFRLGTCAACTKRISDANDYVLLYGETFHRDCAFYRSQRQKAG